MQYQAEILIPLFGILAGISVPIATFVWLYFDAKGKRDAIVEISKNLEDKEKLEELLQIFEERKKNHLITAETASSRFSSASVCICSGSWSLAAYLKGSVR